MSAAQIILGYFVIAVCGILAMIAIAMFIAHIRSKPTDGSVRLGWGMKLGPMEPIPGSRNAINPTRPFEPLEPYPGKNAESGNS